MINQLLLPKAYVEVLEILKHISTDDYNKIPSEIIENMQINKDKEYKYKVTHFEDFFSQEMLTETETILSVLFRDYWATDEQRKRILEKEKYELNILEEEKRKQYNPDDIFQKTAQQTSTNIEILENNTNDTLVEYKESFFTKFKNFILKILHINK